MHAPVKMTEARGKAIELYNRALTLAADKSIPLNANLSFQALCSCVIVDPTFGQGWVTLGASQAEAGMFAPAVASWRHALALPIGEQMGDMNEMLRIDAAVGMGNALHHLGQNDEAREVTAHALTHYDPNNARLCTNASIIEMIDGRLEMALAHAERAHRLDPTHAAAEVQLGWALMHMRKYDSGLRHFEARFPYRLPHVAQYPYPKWQGEPGKKVWVISEQGIGDTLSFARFVPAAAARAKHLHLHVHPELYSLLSFLFAGAGLKNVTLEPGIPTGFPAADAWSSFVSLPTAIGLSNDEIINCPGLAVPPFAMSAQWKNINADLHIGVAWAGSLKSDNGRWKNFPFVHLLDLYKVPGVQLYSLQVDDAKADLERHGSMSLVRDLSPYIRNVMDTAALIRDLDLVVTVESAVGHIAGLMGKPCYIPYSYMGIEYRAGYDGKNPLWYPNHRYFKQGKDMRWEPVFEQIVEAVRCRKS